MLACADANRNFDTSKHQFEIEKCSKCGKFHVYKIKKGIQGVEIMNQDECREYRDKAEVKIIELSIELDNIKQELRNYKIIIGGLMIVSTVIYFVQKFMS